jgi:sortase B
MKANEAGRKTISVINVAVNMAVLTIIMLLITFAGYALWDSEQINHAADKTHYTIYKPTAANEGKSFKELQVINAEVIAWLSVYGTNIDYPVTQGWNNLKYVNTNAEGLYSLSGSIFLDHNNSKNFGDFNSILYGHHMEKRMMFGEIGSFADESIFNAHKYGNLYFDEKDHGIEFFAFIHTSAYNNIVFTPNIQEELRQIYLDDLLVGAIQRRDIGISAEDRIVLLATCSSGSTNGRDILIGRITDELYEDPFISTKKNDVKEHMDSQDSVFKETRLIIPILIVLLLTLILPLIVLVLVIYHRSKKRKRRREP